ncbi:unnamed protein product [Strongylus vulgaris]|uniref:Uncharacterized protein n=1 Tax=Strongylus vulgaris TaxID=40348 RepID=A0A3P7IQQ7_STRVU|nr:unnamed protein product [Strongylus vulgaris]
MNSGGDVREVETDSWLSVVEMVQFIVHDSRVYMYTKRRLEHIPPYHQQTNTTPYQRHSEKTRLLGDGVVFERWEVGGGRAVARYSLLAQVEAAELLAAAASDSEDEII